MKKIAYALLASCLLVPQVNAATVDAAGISTAIDAVAADAVKTKAYCDLSKKFEEIGDDDKKAEAAGDEIEGYFKTLGPEFDAAWDAGQNAGETSAEGKAFEEAMGKLDAKCTP
ncbi:MAG: hypothetical protein ABL893_05200 [Hyphomicrobium sp.]|nr:hypothetical protein [Hyphomicrobium sp.]